jgi:hypothetical protein
MVTVFMRGGLGNQMFQYALGLNLAKRNDVPLVLDTVHISDRFPRRNFTYRTFDLDIFTLTPRFTALSRAARAVPLPGVWLGIDLFVMNAGERLAGRRILYEDERKGFDLRVLAAHGDIILYGRWESERYFSDVESDVRAAFQFRAPLAGKAAEVAAEIAKGESVALHVRRGDFISSKKVGALMAPTGPRYYERAVARIAARVNRPHFFIFSDDIAWCKENIKLTHPATYLGNDTAGPKASNHLELMARCKHNIIANSTFSWWGAWLNKNEKKVVIAPQRWYAGATADADIVPAAWTRI